MSEAAGQGISQAFDYPCRMVTEEEIANYQEFGWAKLKAFIHPDILRLLLERAHERMGVDGDSNPDYGVRQLYFNAEPCQGLTVPELRELIFKVGQSAKRLMNRASGEGIRHFQDFYGPKLPSARQTKNLGNGPTSFHQDYITFAVDRSGGMTFWIPMEPCGPDKGTMSFINGSHRLGILGNYSSYGGRDIREIYPELLDLEMSEQMEYELGDITVHSHLCVHGATANLTDQPRWAYLLLTQPADACWNGAPPEAFDPSHLKPYQTLDDEHFPITAPADE